MMDALSKATRMKKLTNGIVAEMMADKSPEDLIDLADKAKDMIAVLRGDERLIALCGLSTISDAIHKYLATDNEDGA
jgi:hypothetical protein